MDEGTKGRTWEAIRVEPGEMPSVEEVFNGAGVDGWSTARYAVLRVLEEMDLDGTFGSEDATWDEIGCRILRALGLPLTDGAAE